MSVVDVKKVTFRDAVALAITTPPSSGWASCSRFCRRLPVDSHVLRIVARTVPLLSPRQTSFSALPFQRQSYASRSYCSADESLVLETHRSSLWSNSLQCKTRLGSWPQLDWSVDRCQQFTIKTCSYRQVPVLPKNEKYKKYFFILFLKKKKKKSTPVYFVLHSTLKYRYLSTEKRTTWRYCR